MALDKQIHVYSVDTGHFYNQKELNLHNRNASFRREKNDIKKNRLQPIFEQLINDGYSESDLDKMSLFHQSDKDINSIHNIIQSLDFKLKDSEILEEQYIFWKTLLDYKTKMANYEKSCLLQTLQERVDKSEKIKAMNTVDQLPNDRIRYLHKERVNDTNIVSLFDSCLSRTIGAAINEFCDDIIIVQIYYFDIFKDLSFNGMTFADKTFDENGNVKEIKYTKYKYFTSSAGQIRTKKAVFIKEETWEKHQKTLMCGLTIDMINAKGGNNVNKHLAYMALTNSATDLWENFDIEKSIVIDDFETDVSGIFDLIDDKTYEIERISSSAPIPHMDGAGFVLPKLLSTNSMFRAPWIKGLLACFDYVTLIKEKNWSSKIVDIYGEEHDVIEEDIQVIFTKSQFKMYRYYDSWQQYQEFFKKYNCTAGLCKTERKYIKNATINYQMLQTLTDITDDEIEAIAEKSVTKITSLLNKSRIPVTLVMG
jgi:hypothetical protein